MNYSTKLLLLGGIAGASSAAAAEKMNVLYIMTDQQNYDMMSCMMGDRYLSTPGMDFIANNGYAFTNAYCANPVSMPSRFSLVTGFQASTVGVKGNGTKDVNTDALNRIKSTSMGHTFAKAGYETVYMGKTHLYGGSKGWGFDIKTQDPYEEGCKAAVDYLNSRKTSNKEKPFMMFVSFMNPHDICYSAGMDGRYPDQLKATAIAATEEYLAYKKTLSPAEYKSQIPPRLKNEGYIETDANDKDMPDPKFLKSSGHDYRTWTTEERELFRWMYYRLTESVDGLIDKVLTALKESGELDNTIIVFTSDHGELLGAHGYSTKSVLVSACQKIPFVFMGPGIKQGVKDDKTYVCNGLDLLPTLYDLVGIESPVELPGVSLKPYITGKGKKPSREYIVTESSNSYQISDGINKLTVYEFAGAPRMFTNMDEDPLERKNLLKDPKYASTIKTLQAALDKHLADNNLKLKKGSVPKFTIKRPMEGVTYTEKAL